MVDNDDEEVRALRDMLKIEKVPTGIVHGPAEGLFGVHVDLHRRNLGTLRRNLEQYLSFAQDGDGLRSGGLLEGLGEQKCVSLL